jgi:hypothetical protein
MTILASNEAAGVVVNCNCTVRNASSTLGQSACLHYERSLERRLSTIQDIEAIFTSTDDDGVVHVYPVVREYRSELYDELLQQERLIEEEHPQISFEFHVRAHQGRKPHRAVPVGARLVFLR